MIIDIDSNPIINEHQAIVEYYNQFDFFENPREYVFFHVRYLEDGIGGCSGGEEPICEYYSYEYLEEQDREMREAEEQRQREEQQRQQQLEEQRQKELQEYRNIISQNPDVRIDSNTPQEDICHLGGGIVVKCSEFFDF